MKLTDKIGNLLATAKISEEQIEENKKLMDPEDREIYEKTMDEAIDGVLEKMITILNINK